MKGKGLWQKSRYLPSSRWTDVYQSWNLPELLIPTESKLSVKKTYFKVTPEYSISMLAKWRGQEDGVIYLAEATPRTADFINGMLRMRVVDEIILYTLPQIAGTGKHFFQSALPQDEWKLVEHKLYDGGVVFTVYRTEWKPTVFIK